MLGKPSKQARILKKKKKYIQKSLFSTEENVRCFNYSNKISFNKYTVVIGKLPVSSQNKSFVWGYCFGFEGHTTMCCKKNMF